MKRALVLIGIWLVLMAVVIGVSTRKKSPSPEPARLWQAPNMAFFAVTTESSRSMKTDDLRGQPWVANFNFTRCGGPCPVMSGKMAALQRVLPPSVKLVSFTVDPDYDSETVLRQYAARFKADPSRWIFARTSKESLYKMVNEGFRLTIAENRENPPETRVLHSTRFMLVDQDSMVRAYYDSNEEAFITQLTQDVASLMKEAK